MPFIDLPDRIPGLRAQAQNGQPWYQFKNVAADEAELFLYEEIGGWGTLAEDFIAELRTVTASKLRVRMSSPGGSVFEGIALANALRAHPAEVTVQVDGIAASIASVIAMAGDRVVVQPQAMIMCHEAAGVCLGNAQDMNDMAALLDKISGNIADAYVEKAGGTREEWRTRMRVESWFTAEEAVEAGLADEMLPARKPQPAEAEPAMRQFDFAAYGYQGPKQPERPKPAPPMATGGVVENPPVVGEDSCTLTIPIGSALGEQIAAALRACVEPTVDPASESTPEVATPAEPDAVETVDTAADVEPATETAVVQPAEAEPQLAPPTVEPEPSAEVTPEPVAPVVDPAEPEPSVEEPDAWAAAVARLTSPKPDPWADAFAHLVNPQPSSSAATAA